MRRHTTLFATATLALGGLALAPVAPPVDLAGDVAGEVASDVTGDRDPRDRQAAPAVGETDLFNLELVANFDFTAYADNDDVKRQGTDLEFFTTETVVRDADGVVVGADGLAGTDDDQLPATRDFAVVGDHTDGAAVFDITDPEATYLASYITCPHPRADVGVLQFEDAGTTRTLVAISRESGALCFEALEGGRVAGGETGSNGGAGVFELTDPYAPEAVAGIEIGTGGAHNLAFHPTEPILYAWNGELPGGVSTIQIVDLRDWAASGDLDDITPMVGPTTLGSVHDGEFSPDGELMYVASENNYEIFDNSDPADPVRLGAFTPNPGTYAHGYFPTPDGSISITNNESLALGGFFANGSAVCPGEGLGFYDTSDPALPVGPVGVFVPPVQGSAVPGEGLDSRDCTSHFGRVAPNGKVMTLGWYILGTRVVDFSDPTLPVEVAAATISRADDERDEGRGSQVWSAKTYGDTPYIYVGDQERGFDVLRWAGPEACEVAPWMDGWDLSCMDGEERLPVEPAATERVVVAPDPRELAGLREQQGSGYVCRL